MGQRQRESLLSELSVPRLRSARPDTKCRRAAHHHQRSATNWALTGTKLGCDLAEYGARTIKGPANTDGTLHPPEHQIACKLMRFS